MPIDLPFKMSLIIAEHEGSRRTIPQHMGRTDKQIPTRLPWGRKGLTELPPGWICERVNVTPLGRGGGRDLGLFLMV